VEVQHEKDKLVVSQYVEQAPGTCKTIELVYELPKVVTEDGGGKTYSLTWQTQPTLSSQQVSVTVKPAKLSLLQQLPVGFIRKGLSATYKGVIAKDQKYDFVLTNS
jgi:hypothetical protein